MTPLNLPPSKMQCKHQHILCPSAQANGRVKRGLTRVCDRSYVLITQSNIMLLFIKCNYISGKIKFTKKSSQESTNRLGGCVVVMTNLSTPIIPPNVGDANALGPNVVVP